VADADPSHWGIPLLLPTVTNHPARLVGTVRDDSSIVVEPYDNYLAIPAGGTIGVRIVPVDDQEHFQLLHDLRRSQAYGAERLAASGYTIEDIPRLVAEAMANPSPEAVAMAKKITDEIAERARPIPPRVPGPDDERLRRVVEEARAEDPSDA
jgi:hypothetical protein